MAVDYTVCYEDTCHAIWLQNFCDAPNPEGKFFFLATRQVYRNREIFVAIEFLCRAHVLIMYAPRPGPVGA